MPLSLSNHIDLIAEQPSCSMISSGPSTNSTIISTAMITLNPIYEGIGHSCDHKEEHITMDTLANSPIARVQPTDNPYHWEAPAYDRSKISAWVKASWSRTNEIVQLKTGGRTLKRNTAVRRSGKGRTTSGASVPMEPSSSSSAIVVTAKNAPRDCLLVRPKMHRSFSFEEEEQCQRLRVASEESEEEHTVPGIDIAARVDLEVECPSKGQCTRFHEELDGRPHAPRTFSEILGEHFVPTALAEYG